MEEPLEVNETSQESVAESQEEKPEVATLSKEKKSKSNNGLKLAVVLLLLTTIGGVAFGLYEMFKPMPSCGGGGDSKECDCPKCDTKDEENTTDEVSIKDPYLITDLSKKVSWLNDVYGKNEEDAFVSDYIAYNSIPSLYTAELPTEKKNVIATKRFTEQNQEYVPQAQKEAVLKELKARFNPDDPNDIYYYYEKKYHELFGYGGNLPKTLLSGNNCSEQLLYINTLNGYMPVPEGCGGTGWSRIYLRKDRYTKKGDDAFVYARVATYRGWGENILCSGYVDKDYSGCKENVEEVKSSDLDDVATYKFAFRKNSAGTYSFVKVEKVN